MTQESSSGLEGEDLGMTHWADARHWIGVFADLIRFKVGLLERVRREVQGVAPIGTTGGRH